MDVEREKQLNDLLAQALDLPTEQRREFLETACDDATLRSEVWSLVGLDGDLSGFLQRPSIEGIGETEALDPATFVDDAKPHTIGPFRLLEILGEGGMGRVYLAEQHKPVERRVALKLMRSSLSSRESMLRFGAEGQALARLSHPNVAQMYEAATTKEGRPYIAMEYVDGPSIMAYCDDHRLTLDQRLDLFVPICHGVQHAHQKQLLHRDLKPSNILVTEVDGQAVPKVIDFGIVKALDQPLIDATLATGRRIIGTPAYMSPEAIQNLGRSDDLDTRSDVYALGVMLYELLTGLRPYDAGTDPLGQVLRRITEREPSKPSTRVSSLEVEQGRALAAHRRVDTLALRRRLRGDLDSIVMKAIAHPRDERYGSATELAADIQRYRRDQPVTARPASGLYTARKLVRRHRWAVAMTMVVLLAVLVAVAGLVSGLDRARGAERQARNEAQAAEAARGEAQALADFLLGLFRRTSPYDEDGEPKPIDQITALDLLARGAAQVADELEDRPLVGARLHEAIGISYKELGLRNEAKRQLETALDLRRANLGDRHFLVAQTHNSLGQLALHDYDIEAGQRHFGAVLDILDRLPPSEIPKREGEPADFASGQRLTALDGLGRIARRQGDYVEALRRHEEALALAQTAEWPDRTVEARAMTNLAVVYSYLDRHHESEPLYRRARELFARRVGPEHPVLIQLSRNIASSLNGQGRHSEAADVAEETLEGARQLLGEDHVLVAGLLESLAEAQRELGDPGAAEKAYRGALAIETEAKGARHPKIVSIIDGLAETLARQGRIDEALVLAREGLAIRQEVLGHEHREVAISLQLLAELALDGDRTVEARGHLERALAIREAQLDADHPELTETRRTLARIR